GSLQANYFSHKSNPLEISPLSSRPSPNDVRSESEWRDPDNACSTHAASWHSRQARIRQLQPKEGLFEIQHTEKCRLSNLSENLLLLTVSRSNRTRYCHVNVGCTLQEGPTCRVIVKMGYSWKLNMLRGPSPCDVTSTR